MIVTDEMHKMKNCTTKLYSVMIQFKAEYHFELTGNSFLRITSILTLIIGSPVHNNINEFISYYHYLACMAIKSDTILLDAPRRGFMKFIELLFLQGLERTKEDNPSVVPFMLRHLTKNVKRDIANCMYYQLQLLN